MSTELERTPDEVFLLCLIMAAFCEIEKLKMQKRSERARIGFGRLGLMNI